MWDDTNTQWKSLYFFIYKIELNFQSYKKESLQRYLAPQQFIIFKPLSFIFEETIGFDVKASFNQTRWYNKTILRKGHSVSQDFSWAENYKLKGKFTCSGILLRLWSNNPTCNFTQQLFFLAQLWMLTSNHLIDKFY